jgi:hypothetical protein
MKKGSFRLDSMADFEALKNRNLMFKKKDPTLTKRPRPRHEPGKMNKSEEAYANILELRKKAGEIIRWAFEPIKFRLADRTYYTPDFMVTLEDRIEFHEIKGFAEDDYRVKIKVIAEMFPEFLFIEVKKIKGEYNYEYFNI